MKNDTAHGRLPTERVRLAADGVRTIAVTSGKGGVGKTSVVVNLAVAVAALGERVTLLDADYGLGNVDILLGMETDKTLEDVIRGREPLDRVLLEGPSGVRILPAATGVQDLTRLTGEQLGRLDAALAALAGSTDLLLVDTATGISDNVISWLSAATEVVVVSSPEPAAVVDAYAVLKIVARLDARKPVSLVVNCVRDAHEADEVHERLRATSARFLNTELRLLGHVVRDPFLAEAVRRSRPVVTFLPESAAARCFRTLATRLLADRPDAQRGQRDHQAHEQEQDQEQNQADEACLATK